MRLVRIFERGGEDLHEYKRALKKAKEAIEIICELSEDMEDKYSERSESRMRGGYRDDEWDDMRERRSRR